MQQRRTINEFIKAIEDSNGIAAIAANMLGISRTALYKRINRNKKLEEALKIARATNIDYAESKLIKHMNKPDMDAVSLSAVKYFLSTKGKDRGYYTKIETDKNINKPLVISYNLKRANDEKQTN